MRALFTEYMNCGEDWMDSTLVMSETQDDLDFTGGRFNWLTKQETGLLNNIFVI